MSTGLPAANCAFARSDHLLRELARRLTDLTAVAARDIVHREDVPVVEEGARISEPTGEGRRTCCGDSLLFEGCQ